MASLISTVLNESKNIKKVIDDIKAQSIEPNEVIFVDAGSSDGTLEVLQANFTVIEKPGANRSKGRNIAISQTVSEVVAVCDGGTRVDRNWFEQLTKHFDNKSGIDVVAGFFKPDASNFFEKCLSSATIPTIDEIEEDKFLPSSRSVAFRKSAWKKVGGYPEWLPICEDLIFDLKLKKAGFKFKFEPEAIAYWRPREKISSFFRQYFLYGRGDGHAKLFLTRHLIRYTAYLTGFLFMYLSFTISLLWMLPFFAAQIGYFSKFYYRYLGHFPEESEFSLVPAFPYISLLVIVGDLAKMAGYPYGVYERLTGKIKFESF